MIKLLMYLFTGRLRSYIRICYLKDVEEVCQANENCWKYRNAIWADADSRIMKGFKKNSVPPDNTPSGTEDRSLSPSDFIKPEGKPLEVVGSRVEVSASH